MIRNRAVLYVRPSTWLVQPTFALEYSTWNLFVVADCTFNHVYRWLASDQSLPLHPITYLPNLPIYPLLQMAVAVVAVDGENHKFEDTSC